MSNHRVPFVFLSLILSILGVTLVARPVAAAGYSILDLGTLGGDSSEATGINTAGQIVGSSATASGAIHGFLHEQGSMTDLGTMTGGTSSHATGINDAGQIVGYGGINAYGPQFREFMEGFIWQNGSMQTVGALHCPCSFNTRYGTSAAYAIDADGQVVGESETVRGNNVRHAFLWQQQAGMQDIGDGAGNWSISRAFGINAQGQVVGDFAQAAGPLTPPFDRRAFIWQGGARQDLGPLPGHTSSQARGIDSAGNIVGWSGTTEGAESRAVLWANGEPQDLGTLPGDASSQAFAVNTTGQVVGWSGNRAFIWEAGTMTDLNSLIPAGSGWVLTRATAINDEGHIVGSGVIGGQVRAFLLTPDPDPLLVTIDIRPGPGPNNVNPKGHGKIPVAILSTASFDARTTVDQLSLTFGSTGDEPSWDACDARAVDVNGDGLPDLLCHFSATAAAFQPGDTAGILKGRTIDGMPIRGSDTVNTGPKKTK